MTLPAKSLVPDFQIKVNRVPLAPETALDVLGITVLDDIAAPSMFVLRLGTWRQHTQAYTWVDRDLFAVGARVEVWLGYVDRLEPIIAGEVTSLELDLASDRTPQLLVRGYDRRHRLLRGNHTRTFTQMSDSQIASRIARDNGLAPQAVDSRVVHEHVWQHAQSDLGFLSARATAIGYEVVVEDETLHFRPHLANAEPALALDPGRDIESFALRMTSQGQADAVQVGGWDVASKRAIQGKATTGQVQAMGAVLGADQTSVAFDASCLVRTDMAIDSQGQADSASLGQLSSRCLSFVAGEGVCIGHTRLRAGQVVTLDGLGDRFSGAYYLTRAQHSCSAQDGYRTTITVRRNAT